MNTKLCWIAAFAASLALLGCNRSPQNTPERSVNAAPATERVAATLPPYAQSDPSLPDSSVTANLEANAPWTTTRSEAPQPGAPGADDKQTAASVDEHAHEQEPGADARQAVVPGESQKPAPSSAATAKSESVDLANSGADSGTSPN